MTLTLILTLTLTLTQTRTLTRTLTLIGLEEERLNPQTGRFEEFVDEAKVKGTRRALDEAGLARVLDQLCEHRERATPDELAVFDAAVLRAMDVPLEYALGTLRLSTGRHTTEAEVRAAARLIIAEAHRQWAEEPAAGVSAELVEVRAKMRAEGQI